MANQPEPEILIRGKDFHKLVQRDWKLNVKDGDVLVEHHTTLLGMSKKTKKLKCGRLDILVDETGDFVSIIEIKSTDWDRVKPRNRQRLLSSHRRQIWRYIDKFVLGKNIDVCPGIIYPKRPVSRGLKIQIEEYLNDYGLQVVWYHD